MSQHDQPAIQLLGTATVGPKGQVVIPADARDKMGIGPGDKVVAVYVPHKRSVAFIAESQLQTLINKMGAHIADLQQLTKKQ